jgi:hypothetical protein
MAGWHSAAMEKGFESRDVTRLMTLPPQQYWSNRGV